MFENFDFETPDEVFGNFFVHGWEKDKEDERDFKYSLYAPDILPSPLPSYVSLDSKMPPVLNQLTLGCCTGHGIAEVIAYLRWRDGNSANDWIPSRLFIYYFERLLEGTVNQDCGAMIRDGIKVVGTYGAPEEKFWPYDISKFKVKPPAQVLTEATQHKAYNYYRVNWESIDEIKGCLAAEFPIVFGFQVFSEFQSLAVAKTGILPMPGPRSKNVGGHCVVAIGYDDNMQCPNTKTKGAVLVRNSWSDKWGLKGNFWMSYEYIVSPTLSDDFWTIRASY